jgi:outer membrane protein assembly factor BamB
LGAYDVLNLQGAHTPAMADKFAQIVLHDRTITTNVIGTGVQLYFGAQGPAGGDGESYDVQWNNMGDPNHKWELLMLGSAKAAPAMLRDNVYFADGNGDVYGVNSERASIWTSLQRSDTGREDGVFPAGGPVSADLKADAYGVYVATASPSGVLYCLDPVSGHRKWQYFAQTVPLYASPTVTATMVYEYVEGMGVVAIQKIDPDPHQAHFDRQPMWSVSSAIGVVAEDAKHVYMMRHDHAVIAVDKATGAFQYVTQRHDFVAFAVNPKSGVCYAATADGHVMAFILNEKVGTMGNLVMNQMPTIQLAMTR